MTITFFGHRNVECQKIVQQQIIELLDCLCQLENEPIFYCGGYGDFDWICSQAIDRFRETIRPNLHKILVVPYPDNGKRYDSVRGFYDEILYPNLGNVSYKKAIVKRNQWMVDHSTYVITYVRHDWGGAYHTLQYAQKKQKQILIYRNGDFFFDNLL